MLLAAAWMVGGAVCDEAFATKEPAGTFIEIESGEVGVAFEDEEAPLVG